MYSIFGDWELVLASYNSGPGNVSKAIRAQEENKAGTSGSICPKKHRDMFLLLATMYLYEYHNEHGIKADRAVVQHFATDTIMIKSKCHLSKLRT
jgi:membrane-bound lytic murein transglycosylase D